MLVPCVSSVPCLPLMQRLGGLLLALPASLSVEAASLSSSPGQTIIGPLKLVELPLAAGLGGGCPDFHGPLRSSGRHRACGEFRGDRPSYVFFRSCGPREGEGVDERRAHASPDLLLRAGGRGRAPSSPSRAQESCKAQARHNCSSCGSNGPHKHYLATASGPGAGFVREADAVGGQAQRPAFAEAPASFPYFGPEPASPQLSQLAAALPAAGLGTVPKPKAAGIVPPLAMPKGPSSSASPDSSQQLALQSASKGRPCLCL